ncbi:MAG: FAD-binding and (Fe-S)-binding domain-containing protein [Bacteroidota bacterium]
MNIASDLGLLLDPTRVFTRSIDRIANASDASFYRLIPQAVVHPNSLLEIKKLFEYSQAKKIPLVFRAAGTSLSGQSVTDGILVNLSRYWGRIQVEKDGEFIRLGPGVVGSHANRALKPYHRRIGPDPASIDACMIGGILSNNASGMCCGVIENSYHTMHAIQFMLPNGSLFDTSTPEAEEQFLAQEPKLAQSLLELRNRILSSPELFHRIRDRYKMKNTTGYSLNAFIDYSSPLEILAHLLIGAEGTLGFIAEVVLRTLPDYERKYTGLLYFPDVGTAGRAIPLLTESGARALEIMDRASLRSIENLDGAPAAIQQLPDGAAAILVEYQCQSWEELQSYRRKAAQVCDLLGLLQPAQFTEDAGEQAKLWKLRKGIFPAIGAMRAQGTSVLIEDVAFPIPKLAEAILDLQQLFKVHGYEEGIIYGHAKEGNLHFVITQSFNDEEAINRYECFMQDLVRLVVEKYDGALKAEHGTGRNVAPYVAYEWGSDAYAIMQDLKQLIDPQNLLNPGVIINPDPRAHVKDLKSLPIVEAEIDRCIECGFCELSCPSRHLTLTPRQRIVLRREIVRLETAGDDPAVLSSLMEDYQYAGIETCAVDGLCATACPVGINTGNFVKGLRAEGNSARSQKIASQVARHFGLVEDVLRNAVGLGHMAEKAVGSTTIENLSSGIGRLSGMNLPKWNAAVLHRSPQWTEQNPDGPQAVYFPSCISRTMGVPPLDPDAPSLIDVFIEICHRAGLQIYLPEESHGSCCGMPFSSKGYTEAYRQMIHQTLAQMWRWSQSGCLPIVIDSSSCAYSLRTSGETLQGEDLELWKKLKILDSVEFTRDWLLPKLKITPLEEKVILHPNCALRKLNLDGALKQVVAACAREVETPPNLGCCAFAGDRGLLFPELTASATMLEAEDVLSVSYDGYYSSNLTCEMGMALATKKSYRSFLYLVEKATR